MPAPSDIDRGLLGDLEPLPAAKGVEAYYRAATAAEARLILGEVDAARAALREAVAAHGDDLGARATTRKQLRHICRALELDDALLDELAAGRVIHFTGHMIAAPGAPGRFPAEGEAEVKAKIVEHLNKADVGFGYGSLACGADTQADLNGFKGDFPTPAAPIGKAAPPGLQKGKLRGFSVQPIFGKFRTSNPSD